MKEKNKKLPTKTAKEDIQKKETKPPHTKIEGATRKKSANPAFGLVNFSWLNLTNLKIRSKIIMGFIVITTLLFNLRISGVAKHVPGEQSIHICYRT